MSHFPVSDDGELLDSDAAQLAGMPWEFLNGVLQAFVQMSGDPATRNDKEEDARNFEASFCRDVRYLHAYTGDHDCSSTCVKNHKEKLWKKWQRC